jgi:transposase
LVLRDGDRARLADLARLPSVPSGLAKRARMVLLAADGVPNAQIARIVGVSRPTVISWRDRYAHGGIKALEDEPRSGRPAQIDEVDVVVATLAADGRPPQELRITHWSARYLAAELGISFASVARIWRHWGIEPRRIAAFKFATDPPLDPRIRDVVGMYLNPPDNAVVVSVEETFQVQALGRTPLARRGVPEWRTRDHKRQAADALFAALEASAEKTTTDEKITTDAAAPRHKEFLRFLRKVSVIHRGVDLHVVLDNYSAHRHPEIRRWLAQPENHRVTVHVMPPGRSWLSIVEVFFGIVARRAARHGSIRSAKEITAAIGAFTATCGNHHQALAWIKNAPSHPVKPDRNQGSQSRLSRN